MKKFDKKDIVLHTLISMGISEQLALKIMESLTASGLDISQVDELNIRQLNEIEVVKLLLEENISNTVGNLKKNVDTLERLGARSLPPSLLERKEEALLGVAYTTGALAGIEDMLNVMHILMDVKKEDVSKIPPMLYKMQAVIEDALKFCEEEAE